jgi:hypothetical protein
MPHVHVTDLPELDHGSAADRTKANEGGRPDIVAEHLRTFFG